MAAAVPLETTASPAPERTDAQKLRVIRDTIRVHSQDLRTRFPLLQHRQSEIGLGLLLTSLAAMLACAALFYSSVISAWLAIPLIAIACSIAHEIEHDLIHNLYFPRNKRLQNTMFAIVWAMRPDSISPWVRKQLHILHHRVSGTKGDIEERSISNGEAWSFARLLVLLDGGIGALLHLPRGNRKAATAKFKATAKAYFPVAWIHFTLWYSLLAFHSVDFVAASFSIGIAWPAAITAAMPVINFLAVVWLAPNVLRSFSLKFVSSSMHYFGDVEKGNVMQQCQVLNKWWLAPFQLFCANFGSTHAIHHFWVPDPFYLRQMTAPVAHQVFRENGVRFNDLATFKRANRYALALDGGATAA